jgi:hypothetical protein
MATEPDPNAVARYTEIYAGLLYPDQPDLPDEERERLRAERKARQTEMATTLLAGQPLDDAALTEQAHRTIDDAQLRARLREGGLEDYEIDDLFKWVRKRD